MKRYGNLYHQIVEFENLLLAARQAQKGKKFRDNVLKFNYNLENELIKLKQDLIDKTYQPGSYRTFHLTSPKSRLISAAPYRDRVVHHALCNIIVPIFEKTFIDDSYANRLGFGTHRALKKFTHFARNSQYILQCDIRKYFPSIDHEILKQLLRRKLKCRDTLWLDDFALFADDRELLVDARVAIEEYLAKLRVKIHPIKSQLFETKVGATFLGFRVFHDRIRVRNSNIHLARQRLKQLQKDYAQGKIDWETVNQSIRSWIAHLEHGDTWQLRKKIFNSLVWTRN